MTHNRPLLLVFDVNETLSDLAPLRHRFEDFGASADLMPLWFAGILRDGFALLPPEDPRTSAPWAVTAFAGFSPKPSGLPPRRKQPGTWWTGSPSWTSIPMSGRGSASCARPASGWSR
ncbi:MAG: hypothetical protein HOY79_19570 [Streptomyces sp.]|nr:hypothetical protein [Streptomyces sp.]